MKTCRIDIEPRDEIALVHLAGSLDAHSHGHLDRALRKLHEEARHRVVLDCAELDYVSSVALGVLIGFARRARERHGDLKLARLSPKVRNVIELLGFHKVLEVQPNIEQALAAFEA